MIIKIVLLKNMNRGKVDMIEPNEYAAFRISHQWALIVIYLCIYLLKYCTLQEGLSYEPC